MTMSAAPATAGVPERKGSEILEETRKRNAGFGDFQADLRMILRNRHGQVSERKLHISTLEVSGDGDMSLAVFDEPRDIRGTALLTHPHRDRDDDQWLYLPALKRVKRITARNKSGSFMGSEFSYEDIASFEIGRFECRWLRDEVYRDMDCFVVELIPRDRENSGYKRQICWMDKEQYRQWKVEYYDRKNQLMKTLTLSGYKEYRQKFWRAGKMEMVNHLTGKSTTLEWSDLEFGTGLDEGDFNRNSLKRAR